mmetsp:Transcript_3591/g.3018  ORF Transcript_3591/g.3018 Transcript_3591/m.3018 type:complete len:84 (-) Transcript_3591:63-314(-)
MCLNNSVMTLPCSKVRYYLRMSVKRILQKALSSFWGPSQTGSESDIVLDELVASVFDNSTSSAHDYGLSSMIPWDPLVEDLQQ